MDKRKEFESSPRFKGMDFARSETHPDYYESPYANGAWDGWQASRESLVIDLPEEFDDGTVRRMRVVRILENAGVNVK